MHPEVNAVYLRRSTSFIGEQTFFLHSSLLVPAAEFQAVSESVGLV